MPQATSLRLHRGPDSRTTRSSAYALIRAHVSHAQSVHAIALQLATDAELLLEALRYFNVKPAR